jgi:hypothetical protein
MFLTSTASRLASGSALACSILLLSAPRALASETADVFEACASAAERGQVARHQGKLLEARAEFRSCDAAECPGVVRTDCARWNTEVEEETPSVVLRARDARGRDVIDVQVSTNEGTIANHLDGVAVELDPGRYDLRFETPSGAVTTETVLLALGEQRREVTGTFSVSLNPDGSRARELTSPVLSVQPPRTVGDSRPGPTPTRGPGALAYVFAGASAVSLGAFAYFELAGQSGYSDLENGCGRTRSCTSDQVDPVRTDFRAAGALLGAAVVFAGLATWQFLLPRRPATAGWLQTPLAPARGMQTSLLRF